jgi:Mg-chelatase subunit ChlD
LVRTLAEEGIDGVHRLLRERESSDPTLSERLEQFRKRWRRQAARRLGRSLEEYDRRAAELETVTRRSDAEIQAQIQALEARRAAAQSFDGLTLPSPDLWPSVEHALLIPEASWNRPVERPGLLQRLWLWLKNLWRRWRHRTPREKPTGPAGRRIPIATLSDGRHLGGSMLGEALAQLGTNEREELRDRVDGELQREQRELERLAEEKRKAAEAQRRRLEEERAEAERRGQAEVDRSVRAAESERTVRELKERGLVTERGGDLAVTYGLIERFARLLLEEESRQIPGGIRIAPGGAGSTGIYEKGRLRQSAEIAHLDVPGSLLSARMSGQKHIEESTSLVYREITTETVHVVLAFDKSGSMAEGGKLEAAKKALLALYVAIRRRYPDATLDVVAFDNEVRVFDLVELWETRPGSFTNTAEALRTIHGLLRSSRARRREVYLLTDGLPEAYTDSEGRVRSGRLDEAMAQALERARELATVTPLKFALLLFRSDHPEYEAAARQIARTVGGEMLVTDPGSLGVELLVRWAKGIETVQQPKGTPRAPPAAPAARSRGKRRRPDRRMGG